MAEILPLNYRLRLVPDLSRFTFDGHVDIRLRLAEPAAELVLNAAELAVWSCGVRRGDELLPCSFRVVPAAEELHVAFPEALAGEVQLSIDYAGRINDRMAGFYRSRYLHKGRRRYIAITQFEESDARRAFPCMDHPRRKATFDIEMEVARCLAAVANTDIKAQELLKGGKKRVIFETTPAMSTYLVFFGVGDFETLQDPIDGRVRVLTLPPSQKYGRFGLEFGRKALAFSESYYGVPYPLSKMDLIAVPDFAFGAMENWGAITFRENLLLHHPGITSRSGEERICEVIAHEIAHQWFGNLVTPSDWKYLWLNESFATYFGYGVVAHFYPGWGIWQQFLHGTTATALQRDALLENVAIEIPGGEHLVINTSTAPIIYNKGGSILRQVEGYIGSAYFQKGLRHYLHAGIQNLAPGHNQAGFAAAKQRREKLREMLVDLVEGFLQPVPRFSIDPSNRIFQRIDGFRQVCVLRIEMPLALRRCLQLFQRRQIDRTEGRNGIGQTGHLALQILRLHVRLIQRHQRRFIRLGIDQLLREAVAVETRSLFLQLQLDDAFAQRLQAALGFETRLLALAHLL